MERSSFSEIQDFNQYIPESKPLTGIGTERFEADYSQVIFEKLPKAYRSHKADPGLVIV